MKTLKIMILFFVLYTQSYGQDGSDIRYYKASAIDSSFINKLVQFDFFNRSFRSQSIDTVTINIDNTQIKFIEVRKDNGYNNWFSQQYLQSFEKIDEQTIRISRFKLDGITANEFIVTMYVDFYNADNKLLSDKSMQIKYRFDRKDITEVLVKSKQL